MQKVELILEPHSGFELRATGSRIQRLNGELHSNYILLYFAIIGLEWDSITLFTKMNLFFLPKLTFQHHLHKIYMVFYLLTWTCFNGVNGGRNILINSQLSTSSDKKKWNKTEKDRNEMEKESNSNESDLENEIPDLNSLKRKQTSGILTVAAVMMRKKLLNIK